MKSAKEWAIEFEWENPSDASGRSEIEAIQRDALLHAAKVARACGGNHRDSTIRNNAQICAQAIEAEAQKLEGQ